MGSTYFGFMVSFIVPVYIVLVLIFLAGAAFIFRHFRKYGYLSPGFKPTIIFFALISLILLGCSFYFLTRLMAIQGDGLSLPSTPSSGNVSF